MINVINPNTDLAIVRDTKSPGYRRELRKAASEFEGILVARMFKAMRDTVPSEDSPDGGYEKGIYEDMLFTELSSLSARAEGIGIAEMLFKSLVGDESGVAAETETPGR